VIFHAMLASFRVVFGGARARVTPYHLSRLYFWNSSISHAKSVFGLWRQAHRGMRTFFKACICCCRIFIYANFQVGTGPKRTYRAALLYFVLRHHYQTLNFLSSCSCSTSCYHRSESESGPVQTLLSRFGVGRSHMCCCSSGFENRRIRRMS
jgi:hypothetical protein